MGAIIKKIKELEEELETKRMVFEFETIKSYIIETFLEN